MRNVLKRTRYAFTFWKSSDRLRGLLIILFLYLQEKDLKLNEC